MCEEHFSEQYKRFQIIPGVKERAATAIIAETGVDMSMFAKVTNLVGWCGLKPRNDESNWIMYGNKYGRVKPSKPLARKYGYICLVRRVRANK